MVKRTGIIAFAIALLTGSLTLAANSAGYDWQSVVVGGGGFVDGIIFHPTIKGIMYARTDMGGAYRWNPSTSAWIPITDWIGSSASDNYGILAIGLDNNDSNKVYLLTGKYTASWAGMGYVLASSDGGRTFPQMTQLHAKCGSNQDGRGAGERIAVDPNLGSILYVAGTHWYETATVGYNGTLWKSTDGAKNFDSVKTGPTGNGIFVLFDSSSSTKGSATKDIYASFDSSSAGAPAIWRSRDAGATWNVLSGQPTGYATHGTVAGHYIFFSINKAGDKSPNGLGPMGMAHGAVWRFNTKDNSWAEISPVKDPGYGYGTVSAYNRSPGRLVVSSVDKWDTGDEVWLSTDTGSTWITKRTNGTLDKTFAPWIDKRSPHWLASVQYDPFDSTVALFGTGYGVFRTTNLLSSNPTWAFNDSNFEETVAMQLVSPPAGAPLLSAMGDQGGFRHVRLDKSPTEMYVPDVGTTLAMDVAWKNPAIFVKAHNAAISNGGKTFGSISVDSGKTWTGFATQPPVLVPSSANGWSGGGGTKSIVISADASSILWTPTGPTTPYVSKDKGKTWTATTGTDFDATSMSNACPAADRANGNKFYLANAQKGTVSYSTDGGSSFVQSSTKLDSMASWEASKVTIVAAPGYEGDVWVTWGHVWSAPRGLYHTVNGGSSFTRVSTVADAWLVGFGKAAPGKTYPAIYMFGVVGADTGIFLSKDSAATWTRINDPAHQYGGLHSIVGDPNVYGRVYIGTEGRGVVYGQPAGSSPIQVSTRKVATISAIHREGMRLVSREGVIQLLDLSGKTLRQSRIVNGNQTLSLAGLPRGIFIARHGAESMRIMNMR